jgi:hypothetical protein
MLLALGVEEYYDECSVGEGLAAPMLNDERSLTKLPERLSSLSTIDFVLRDAKQRGVGNTCAAT